MAKEVVQISNGLGSGMFLIRFILEVPNRVLQDFIMSQFVRESRIHETVPSSSVSNSSPPIEFLTRPINLSSKDDWLATVAIEKASVTKFEQHMTSGNSSKGPESLVSTDLPFLED